MFSAPLYQFLQGMITSKYQHFDGFESVPILKWANFNRILTQDIFLKQRVCHMLVLLKLVHCYRNCCMFTWEGCGDIFSFPWCSSKVVFLLSYLLCLLVLLFFFCFLLFNFFLLIWGTFSSLLCLTCGKVCFEDLRFAKGRSDVS